MTHIINQQIPEEHRQFIWDLAHSIKTYRKMESRWRDACRLNDHDKTRSSLKTMLDFEWMLYENYQQELNKPEVKNTVTMSEIYRDMAPEELALCNLRLHTAVMCVDQIESCIMTCDELLRRYYPNGRVESFVPLLKLGEEARRLRQAYVGDNNQPDADALYADYADSIGDYLEMRMRSMLKKLHKLKQKHQRHGNDGEKARLQAQPE